MRTHACTYVMIDTSGVRIGGGAFGADALPLPAIWRPLPAIIWRPPPPPATPSPPRVNELSLALALPRRTAWQGRTLI